MLIIEDDCLVFFVILSGVKVYGGFLGIEEILEECNIEVNIIILSGEIGDVVVVEDNSYSVVYFFNVSVVIVLDGFVIIGGYVDGLVEGVDLSICGVGVFNNGEVGVLFLIIVNCLFLENFFCEGVVIYNYVNEGEVFFIISDCKFVYNCFDFNGGVIFNDGNFGICNLIIKNCSFEGNEFMYGVGILNCGLYGEC